MRHQVKHKRFMRDERYKKRGSSYDAGSLNIPHNKIQKITAVKKGILNFRVKNPIKSTSQQVENVDPRLNVAITNVNIAKDYTKKKLANRSLSISALLPKFEENYLLMKRYLNQYSLNIPRYKMPVIEPQDMEEFERRLTEGYIDIFKPWAKPGFSSPKKFKTEKERLYWLSKGKKDKDMFDDKILVNIIKLPAKQLRPLQSQVWLNLLIKYIVQYGVPTSESPTVNTTLIISRDYYIIDGHHRWGQVMLSNPNLKMKCLYVPFSIKELLKLGKSYGEAIGNPPNL